MRSPSREPNCNVLMKHPLGKNAILSLYVIMALETSSFSEYRHVGATNDIPAQSDRHPRAPAERRLFWHAVHRYPLRDAAARSAPDCDPRFAPTYLWRPAGHRSG